MTLFGALPLTTCTVTPGVRGALGTGVTMRRDIA